MRYARTVVSMRKTTNGRLVRGSLNWRMSGAFSEGGGPAAYRALSAELQPTKAGCLEWVRSQNGHGYGRHSVHADTFGVAAAGNWHVHRLAYWLYHGELHHAESVHHICGNRTCANIEHLQLISQRENAAEMLERKAYRGKIDELEAEVLRLRILLYRRQSDMPSAMGHLGDLARQTSNAVFSRVR